jgi:hypothetical protein
VLVPHEGHAGFGSEAAERLAADVHRGPQDGAAGEGAWSSALSGQVVACLAFLQAQWVRIVR